MTADIVTPSEGIARMLTGVDSCIAKITDRDVPTDVAMTWTSLAHVQATAALVHAVRELTDVLRDRNADDDHTPGDPT